MSLLPVNKPTTAGLVYRPQVKPQFGGVEPPPAGEEPDLPEKHDIFFSTAAEPQFGHLSDDSAAEEKTNSSNWLSHELQ